MPKPDEIRAPSTGRLHQHAAQAGAVRVEILRRLVRIGLVAIDRVFVPAGAHHGVIDISVARRLAIRRVVVAVIDLERIPGRKSRWKSTL